MLLTAASFVISITIHQVGHLLSCGKSIECNTKRGRPLCINMKKCPRLLIKNKQGGKYCAYYTNDYIYKAKKSIMFFVIILKIT
jgi:hypothetical protein